MKDFLKLVPSTKMPTKFCKCGVEIPSTVTHCGSCLIEELKKNLPSGADGKLILEFRRLDTKEAA